MANYLFRNLTILLVSDSKKKNVDKELHKRPKNCINVNKKKKKIIIMQFLIHIYNNYYI